MRKNALWKDIFRDIKKSKGRFISIAAIIALGVMLFTGVKIAPIDMKTTADKYYDDYNLMDLRLISTMGLTDKDVKDIKDIEGVLDVEPANTIDVVTKVGADEIVLRVHSIPDTGLIDNEDYINRVNLIEGRLPEKSGECVIGSGSFESLNLNIGDKITVTSGNKNDISDSLKSNEYTIVGKVETPYYLTGHIGNSSIGNGTVKSYIFIKQSEFKSDVYSDIYVTVKGAKEVNSYEKEYFNVVDKVTSSIEDISILINDRRYNEIIDKANEELSKGKQEYEDKKLEVELKLKDAEAEIENSRNTLNSAEAELNNKEQQLNNSLQDGENKISIAESELNKKEKELEEGINTFYQAKDLAEKEFVNAEATIADAEVALEGLINQKVALEQMLNDESLSEDEKASIKLQIDGLNNIIQQSTEKINLGKNEIQNKKNELETQEAKLNSAKIQLENGRSELNKSKSDLKYARSQGYAQIDKARKDIEEGKSKLAQGQAEYQENKKLADEELTKAENEIKDSEDKINDIDKPELYVLDRNSHYSYVDFENSANSIGKLSNVFPLFFFVVAALVCLTTMTRMVDEQRTNIGTMKALGYDQGSIAKKFIIYASLASISGCIVGCTLGFTVLPLVIFDAYKILYILPDMTYVVNIPLLLIVLAVAIGITTLAAYTTCRIELIETPAILMRPKSPKEGKRILLERIPFIWNRFSFIGKVTIRNIFRYKKRFFMTVIGIAGSTALLLAGFGIKDSIKTVVSKQYGELTKYQMVVNLENDISSDNKNNIESYLKDNNDIKEYLFVRSENSKALANSVEKDINIITTSDINRFDDFEHLQDRESGKTIDLPSDGVAISEKLAKLLGVKVGDEITIINSNDKKGTAKIGAIVEHYIQHYIYINDNYYRNVFGEGPENNGIFLKLNDENSLNNISNFLVNFDGVSGIVNNGSIKNNFDDTIKSLDLVVIVLILCAGSLSFIVLYNLTNVNISERIREIATIKVLGFYDKEVSAYIFRENILLTVIGLIGGLILGDIFHKFIMVTVEMDYVMFGRSIDMKSFIIASILTIIFSLLVNWSMYFKLKNVEMVESLKSVD